MSRKIQLCTLSLQEREQIGRELTLTIEPGKYSRQVTYIHPFDVGDDGNLYVPFGWDMKIPRPLRVDFSRRTYSFNGTLRPTQIPIFKESISFLNKTGSCLIAAFTGVGKTFLSIYIAHRIKLKVLIIVNRVILADQWKNSIINLCPDAKVQIVKPKSKMDDHCDFIIMNAQNIFKRDRSDFKDIGFMCVDECHLIMAEKMSRCMGYVCPRYLLGLSATPWRNDGMNRLFELYFGNTKIVRELYRPHTVKMVKTGFKPVMEQTESGKVNWGRLLESISLDEKRNRLIVKLTKTIPKKVILIITKRVSHTKLLFDMLKAEGEKVDYLTGNKQEFDRTCRILIGTVQKCGVGFDFPAVDSIILAIDVESYFEQILGRSMRREDSSPIIFDLLDDNPILFKHFQTRKKVYKKAGGKISYLKIKNVE